MKKNSIIRLVFIFGLSIVLFSITAFLICGAKSDKNSIDVSYGDENIYISKNNDSGMIALTFDDGPHEKYTKEIISILKENDVPATFFVIGKNAENHPEIVKYTADEGFEVGIHTYSHGNLNKMSENKLREELDKSRDILKKITGNDIRLFRPPEGVISKKVIKIAREKGYPIILWSVDTNDWRGLSKEKIVNTVKKDVRAGSIILFHDFRSDKSTTPDALRELIPYLKEQGYTFVTVSELLGL